MIIYNIYSGKGGPAGRRLAAAKRGPAGRGWAAAVLFAAVPAMLVAAMALPGAAAARRACSARNSDPLAPVLTNPCAGAQVRAGHNFTFRVRVRDPYAAQQAYFPYLDLTRQRPRHGVLPADNGYGIYAQMTPVRNRPGQFSYRAPPYHVPGYWLFRMGVWYVQVLQVDGAGVGAVHYGRVEKINIR